MDTKQVQNHLRALGWPIAADGSYGPATERAVRNFQRGFAFYDLLIDGMAGDATHRALTVAVQKGGKASEHFAFKEFKCKCNRKAPFCGGDIWVRRELVRGLEVYRRMFGPTAIASGCRCVAWNRKQGGKPNSIHRYGGAADLEPRVSLNAVRNLRVFSGIGYVAANGRVRHADIRGQADVPQTTGGTTGAPTTWKYG